MRRDTVHSRCPVDCVAGCFLSCQGKRRVQTGRRFRSRHIRPSRQVRRFNIGNDPEHTFVSRFARLIRLYTESDNGGEGAGIVSKESLPVSDAKIDFVSKDCGYMLLCGKIFGQGHEQIRDLFKTVDGGKTWAYLKSNFPISGDSITDMDFTDSDTGYICESNTDLAQSDVYRTSDGGSTWCFCSLTQKEKTVDPKGGSHAFAPYFIGSRGYLLVYTEDIKENSMFLYFVSTDNGETWKYEAARYNLTTDFLFTD